MPNQIYIDVHVIQTVPPSNLNRDDAGSPKQATYGGARRARVSSQAWKRATRMAFAAMPVDKLGTRTKRILALLSERLIAEGLEQDEASRVASQVLAPLLGSDKGKISMDKNNKEHTAYTLFLGYKQIDELCLLAKDNLDQLGKTGVKELKKKIEAILNSGHPLDVALFGRMVADIATLNVDAATQVAHALSTHPVEIEFDYYTAVDDENPEEDTGAAMIGTVEFNSATLYRFATVSQQQLIENLGGDVDSSLFALRSFIDAFARSMPTGHITSFAHRTVPNLVCVTVRGDQPVNLVSAFEDPVRSSGGIAKASCLRFAEEMTRVERVWGLEPLSVFTAYDAPEDEKVASVMSDALGSSRSFAEVVDGTIAAVEGRLSSSDSLVES